jgi:tetratricopeptide (TPR) repeat protein
LAEAYYRLGITQLKLNDGGGAYESLSRVVSLDPHNAAAKVELAGLCLSAYSMIASHPAALYKQAQALTNELAKATPNSTAVLRLKARIAAIDRRPADAVEDLRRAVQSSPRSVQLKTALAETLIKNNQTEEGERIAKDVVAHYRKYTPAYELLYSLYSKQGRSADTEALLKTWITNDPQGSQPVLRLAVFYHQQNRTDDSERALNSLLQRRQASTQANVLVGDFHAMLHDTEKALADYQRGVAADGAHEGIYHERMASVLAGAGRYQQALEACNGILAKHPNNGFARALKIEALLALGGAAHLETAVAVAKSVAPDASADATLHLAAGEALMRKGLLDLAEKHYQQAAKMDRQAAAPHVALARLNLTQGKYPAALEQANVALAIQPDDQEARLIRITSLTGTGSYAEAKVEAEQLPHDEKNAAASEMQLGSIALAQKRYSEAEAHFRRVYREGDPDLGPLTALIRTYIAEKQADRAFQLAEVEAKRHPDSTPRSELLVTAAEAAGKRDVALAELRGMAAKDPKSAALQMRIAEFERQQGDLKAALQALEQVREIAPAQRGIDAAIGDLYNQLGWRTEAMANYRKALAKAPDDPGVLNNLAFLIVETGGDLKEALQFATAANRKAPNNASLEDTLAWIHIKQGNPAAALPILSSLTHKSPENPSFHYHLAVALMAKGDRAAAKQQLEAALSVKPGQPVEGEIRGLLSKVQ